MGAINWGHYREALQDLIPFRKISFRLTSENGRKYT
jgi:hypothetical protein